MESKQIIFYDGFCPMCNSWVKRLIRWDKQKIFRFASLQGEIARQILSPIRPDYLEEDTILFFDSGEVYSGSTAALKIMGNLPFPVSLISMGLIIPVPIRDRVYRWVADRRYRFGARYATCPLPPPEWRDRFL